MNLPFNDVTNETGLCQEVDRICGTSSTNYPLKDKARRANMGKSRFITIALENDTRWQFDDSNQTDLPIGTTNLVSGQQDYSFESGFLKILKVEVKDADGNYQQLTPIDRSEYDGSLETYFSTNGQPEYYDKVGNSVLLFPSPSSAVTAGLRVHYQRDGVDYVSTDTTKTTGIPSIFDELIAWYIAEPYLMEKTLTDISGQRKYNALVNKIEKKEQEVANYYSKRDKDVRKIISGKIIDCK
jgi:hypothetical protein